MYKTLIILALLLAEAMPSSGQAPTSSKLHLEVRETDIADDVSRQVSNVSRGLRHLTNYNPSVTLNDSAIIFLYDSFRTDGDVTIITVYETDADSIVGLWQIGSGRNRALWLNSQRASYEDFAVTYRTSTEQGVVIHTMLYRYPPISSTYDGHDTLYIGRDGNTIGGKNFCALYYYPGNPGSRYLRLMESALAIRYGAQLHGPYFNSISDTLWNPIGADSLFSLGVCGIGRDDSLSLLQTKSTFRDGHFAIEAVGPMENLSHVMIGHDEGVFGLGNDIVLLDTIPYMTVERRWKIRTHYNGSLVPLKIMADIPLPSDAVRLMIEGGGARTILSPSRADSVVFSGILLQERQDYILTLLVNPSVLSGSKSGRGMCGSKEQSVELGSPDFNVAVHPNPTAGFYTADIGQSKDDFVSIQVLDAAGRLIEQYTTKERLLHYRHTGMLDTDGVYYVTVSSNGRQKTVKVVVVK